MKYLTPFAAAAIALTAISCPAQTVSESKSLDLTLDNLGAAIVRDVRTLTLIKGENRLEVNNLPGRLYTKSIVVRPTGPDFALDFLERDYRLPPAETMDKLIGAPVWFDGNKSGILLGKANDDDLAPVRLEDGRVMVRRKIEAVDRLPEAASTMDPDASMDFPWDWPPAVSLGWLVCSPTARQQDVEIHYCTEGLSWVANYVALINKNNTSMDLTGWVTVDNTTGATFTNASIGFKAGNVRRFNAQGPEPPDMNELEIFGRELDNEDNYYLLLQERDHSKHNTYTFDRLITLKDHQTKQLALMSAGNVRAKTRLVYDPRREWWEMRGRPYNGSYRRADTAQDYHKVHANIDFVNSKANHLGRPLPWGKVRVLKIDDDGSEQFIGEDELFATAQGKTCSLYIGDAFDVSGDYRRFNAKTIDKNNAEECVEAVIHNHKDQSVVVDVTDRALPGWRITASSHKFTRVDESTFVFPLRVPANGTAKVTYTVHTTRKDEDQENEEY